MEKNFDKLSELTNDEAIDAIYDLCAKAMPELNLKREPLKIDKVGDFGIVNPGPKKITKALVKIDRKIRTKADKRKKTPLCDIIDQRYANKEAQIFDKISDWTRFTVIIQDFKSAPFIIAYFLGKLGGNIDIHDRVGYKGIHQHGIYKGIKFEVQFHTPLHAELKRATDPLYHEAKELLTKAQRTALSEEIDQYCKVVYGRTDFNENLDALQEVVDLYQSREPSEEKQKLKYFTEVVSKSHLIQADLEEHLKDCLTELTKMSNTILLTKPRKNNTETIKDAGK